MFGGPPDAGSEGDNEGLPQTRINRLSNAAIRFDGIEMEVSRYAISSDMGTMHLYARGAEMLGLYAGEGEESLFVYRADYFEDGFEIVDVPAVDGS